jgi:hypothetical protein
MELSNSTKLMNVKVSQTKLMLENLRFNIRAIKDMIPSKQSAKDILVTCFD